MKDRREKRNILKDEHVAMGSPHLCRYTHINDHLMQQVRQTDIEKQKMNYFKITTHLSAFVTFVSEK